MRAFPVSGAEISIGCRVFTGTIRVRLALHISTLTKFNLVGGAHTLYLLFCRKEGGDIKVKSRTEI